MRLWDLLKMARENLLRRKLRTLLTVLSIVIGTISIVLMVAIGIGIQDNVKKQFDSFGSLNVLEVTKQQSKAKTSRFYEQSTLQKMTDSDIALLSKIDGVELVAPTISTNVKLVTSGYEIYTTMVGIDPIMMESSGFKVKEGRLLTDNYHQEIVFGDKALEYFQKTASDNPNAAIQRPDEEEEEQFDYSISFTMPETEYPFEPLKERYKMQINQYGDNFGVEKMYSFSGVGILVEGDYNRDYSVFVPIGVLDKILRNNYEARGLDYSTNYTNVQVRVSDIEEIGAVQKEIEQLGYSVFSMMSVLDSVNGAIRILQVALGAIGAISLLVAAIGITNTMVMAITERKKEIGVMKVIGATLADIKRLFLLEASLIGLLGGAFGLLFCVLISKIITGIVRMQAVAKGQDPSTAFNFTIPVWLVVFGLVFTTVIGLASGYLPALKAMKSSALEAIRND